MQIAATVTTAVPYARYIQWGARRVPRRGEGAAGPPGMVPVARVVDRHGHPVTIYGPANPGPPNATRGRGGVVLDLLRDPGRVAQGELRAAMPSLIMDQLRRAGVVSG